MTKFYSLVLILIFSFLSSQNLDWFYTTLGKRESPGGATQQDGINNISSIAINSDESVYFAGNYTNNVGFDENATSNFQLLSPLGYPSQECYVAKIDKNKKYLWHKTITIGYNSTANIHSVVIDKKGNVIVAGSARGNNIDLNPNDSSSPIYDTDSNLQSAIFVNKYDKDGNFIYGSFYKGGHGNPKLTIDNNNNIIIVGNYINYNGYNTDFDLSNQVYYLTAGSGWYENYGFILKNDEDGKFIWVKYISGWNSVNMNSLMTDSKNNILTLSNNESFFNFNGEKEYRNIGSTTEENYLCKIDPDGNFVWAQNFGGNNSYLVWDTQAFDIDTDDSIVLTTAKINKPLTFQNHVVDYPNYQYGSVIFKIDQNKNYLWHAHLNSESDSYYSQGTNVSIASDHTITWSLDMLGIYSFYHKNQLTETIKLSPNASISDYSTILKLDNSGKLIYNKHQISKHDISRFDKINNKIYFSAGRGAMLDRNPDQSIRDFLSYNSLYTHQSSIQKLDKCYSGTPDGDSFLYTCVSETKKIKDLYPKTSYSSWYDSPTSITPLSPETVLETKNYYASTQDISCSFNPTRLEVDVLVFQNPPKLIVPNFTFCNLSGQRILDLKINNNKDVEFFDDKMNSISLGTLLEASKKYYVRQVASHYPYTSCRSDLAEFYVYDISTPPAAVSAQTFCKIANKKISDIVVTATNPKWYYENGMVITNLSEPLADNTKYYVTQNASGCESGKKEILVTLSDPNPPKGDAIQDFCSASNPSLKNMSITGTAIKWFDPIGTQIPETTPLVDGTTYYASQTINNCESTQKLAIKVNVVTNYLSATDFTDTFCNDTTANFKTIDLDDYKKELITNPQDYTFEFRNSSNLVVSGNTNLNIGSNIFDVKIKSALGCYQDVKLSLTLNEKPKIDLPTEKEFCDNLGTELDAGLNAKYTYSWSTGETSHKIKADKEQTYSVTVTTHNGCTNSASVIVKKAKLATIQNILITNNNATVIMSFAGDYLYSLDQINWQSSNKLENLTNGNYTVYVKTNLGCDLGSKSFTIFSLSNIFSPNGDGINDTWKIPGIENYPNSEIRIIDKNGNMVVNTITKGETYEWNGESGGRKLSTDSYWYQIKITDGRILEGYVVIKNRN
ncbi:T9SS type B sorting domain-containing protein [Epilithonimonas ginsengisoli]|uniref:T9SS type B sorting domain-containing protein n=1 Tax=Epilithonimonas ginsengisoli TaxID=1245592 RepID=A0ABU4JFB5_9FLAO|nr:MULTISPECIES: T9SS type B sorting domain-containing protein [Chryseobacterium group]MBV6879726.1 T9SS type B sorting domain-containing protein [Epilithonimonas sp. FP105]MDW8548365.1 T9SS type B sorting domain-containing protein [Epilithonimonas ginsengisoli]OAH72596.1 hypothetical protein AXA65_10260 [Chryseobacterium sp. FP211-J200]